MTKVNLKVLVRKIKNFKALSAEDFRDITISQFGTLCSSLSPDEQHHLRIALDGIPDLLINTAFFLPGPEVANALGLRWYPVATRPLDEPLGVPPSSIDAWKGAKTMVEAYWCGFRDAQKAIRSLEEDRENDLLDDQRFETM